MGGNAIDFLKLDIPAKLNYPETHLHSLVKYSFKFIIY